MANIIVFDFIMRSMSGMAGLAQFTMQTKPT